MTPHSIKFVRCLVTVSSLFKLAFIRVQVQIHVEEFYNWKTGNKSHTSISLYSPVTEDKGYNFKHCITEIHTVVAERVFSDGGITYCLAAYGKI